MSGYCWERPPWMNTDLMEIFEDPQNGSYTTRKMFMDQNNLAYELEIVKLSSIRVLL